MITVISGTNRPDSNTNLVCQHYINQLKEKSGAEPSFIDLANVRMELLSSNEYSTEDIHNELIIIQNEMIIPAEKLLIIAPEYNGGMPGILKLFIDQLSVQNMKESFFMKKACLTGVSAGRAGNLRGMEHLTGVLNYLNVVVYPNRLPISKIDSLLDERGALTDVETWKAIDHQIDGFLAF